MKNRVGEKKNGEELLGTQARWRVIPRPQHSNLHPGRGYSVPKPFLNNPYMSDSNLRPFAPMSCASHHSTTVASVSTIGKMGGVNCF